MSLVDVDSWFTEYEACERLNHTIIAQLNQRDKRQRLSPEYNRLTATIQIGLKQFQTELGQLRTKLDDAAKSQSIAFEEVERRQRQIDILQSQLKLRENKFAESTRSDRSSLLEQQQPLSSQSSWQTSANALNKQKAKRTESKNPFDEEDDDDDDVESLKQRQIGLLEEQNRGLESLSQTISRQRALATQLGREVEDQNDILDNLANTMERVDTRVHVETGNVGQISRRDSTWGYWIVIVGLLVAIIVVVFT